MRMKRTLTWIIAMLILAGLFGCGLEQAPAETAQVETAQVETEQTTAVQQASAVTAALVNSNPVSVILGRPTEREVTASVLTKTATEVYVEWGASGGSYPHKSETLACDGTKPVLFLLSGLNEDALNYYRVSGRAEGEDVFSPLETGSIHTARNAGETFRFAIQSDSHLKNKADEDLYAQSMANMAALQPDFVFDLGDAFINDLNSKGKAAAEETVAQNYRDQLPYFSMVAKNAPLFLTIGNHEGEYGYILNGAADNLARTSTLARTTYYPNPVPNGFYSGNAETEAGLGAPQNYYAFTWGNALFVSIDPYRYSTVDPYGKGSGWDWTLGKTQYDWFRSTLENSDATFKFVFSHHAIGNMRGGAEVARLYEWGGQDKDGNDVFDRMRPGWGKPIQQVMADAGVTVFFQGHDHVFAREVVDGVVYQSLPKPAEMEPDAQNNFEYYPDADLLLNSGFLSVTVSPEKVSVGYYRSNFVSTDSQVGNTGLVYGYDIDTEGNVSTTTEHTDDASTYPAADKDGKANKAGKSGKTSSPSATAVLPETTAAGSATPQPLDVPTELTDGAFSFCLEADPHWDDKADAAVFQQSISKIASLDPSFLIDLGDLSMAEKLCKTQREVQERYAFVREQFAPLGDIPLYLVLGNHDGETGWSGELAQWAREERLALFPPNAQAEGDPEGAAGNYYSITYKNALFVVLDPYTFTTERVGKSGNGWASTLGEQQHRWLEQTLKDSTATWKFVFIHHLVGGIGKDQRGGAEAARFFEWGGCDADGTYRFDQMRAGWSLPIRDLLEEYGVNAVFHGHDHFYAHQEDGGIVYQLVPQPATAGSIQNTAEYGYTSGTFLPSPGFLRVVVSNERVMVEYWMHQADGTYRICDTYDIEKQDMADSE